MAVAACLNVSRLGPLNESPSEKEGKYLLLTALQNSLVPPQ